MPGPRLTTLRIADDPSAWSGAGFTVDIRPDGTGSLVLGPVVLLLDATADSAGIVGWSFDGLSAGIDSIDGISVDRGDEPAPAALAPHPNGIDAIDHVVMISSDLDRALDALVAAGFEPRRIRDVPGTDRRQVFLWAGDTIIELVGPIEATGTEPSRLWGLALTSPDLDATATSLGDGIGEVTEAVQPGRRIGTIKTKQLGISVPLAVMSPHPSRA